MVLEKHKPRIFWKTVAMVMALALFIVSIGTEKTFAAEEKNTFEVPVKLMHAYEKSQPSMGNPAMRQTAVITETKDGADIELQFTALDFMNMHGHLLKLYAWDGEPAPERNATCKDTKVITEEKDVGLDGKQMVFPSKIVIHRSLLREKEFFVRVRVDAMDSIAGGDGKGEQNARLVFDYSKAPAVPAGGKIAQAAPDAKAPQEEKHTTIGKNYDLSKLKDGNYTVKIDLWHMHEDRPSMGNGSMNHLALLKVKNGKVECQFTVHPMGVSGIVASLITFQYPDEQGKLAFAEAVEKKLEGGKASKFSFPLYKGEEFMHCMVDPNVAAMGNKPVDARFRFYWDTLKKVSDTFVLEGSTETSYGDVYTPPVDQTDKASGIRLLADERVLASGVVLKVEEVKDGAVFQKAADFGKKQGLSLKLYKIDLVDEKGSPLKPVRQIRMQFPLPKNAKAEKCQIINFAKDGTPNPLQAKNVEGKMEIVTAADGYYAVATPQSAAIPAWAFLGASIVFLLVVIALIMRQKKEGKKSVAALALFLIVGLSTQLLFLPVTGHAAAAAPENGAYITRIFGSYLNPETGKTEDGGTQNAAIGEGMVDGVVTPSDPAGGINSVFHKPAPGEEKYADALIEKRLDGKMFATIRLYLMNFINFSEKDGPFFKVQRKDGTYQKTPYQITKSQMQGVDGINYSDFRFEVPAEKFNCSIEMFVNPMGRAVKYFVISTGELQKGNKDFNDYFVQDDAYYLKKKQQEKMLLIGGGVAVVAIIVAVWIVKKNKTKKQILSAFLLLLLATSLSACAGKGPVYSERQLPEIGKGIKVPEEYLKDETDLNAVNKDKKSEPEGQERVVCTSVALCEMMNRLDVHLVGRPSTKLHRMPPRYDNTVQIGMPMNPNMEVIYSLKPTVVYCPDTLQDWLKEGFEKHHLPISFVDLRSVEGLYRSVETIGKRFGKSENVQKLLKEYHDFLAKYQDATKGMKKPRVLLLMGLPGSYVVATPRSYVGSLLAMSGAENIFEGDGKSEFMNLSTEEMLARDPDIILRTVHAMPEVVNEMFRKEFAENTIWKNFRAVKNGNVYDLDAGSFGMSANFEYPKGLEQLRKIYTQYNEKGVSHENDSSH